jgi:hypothetical protein
MILIAEMLVAVCGNVLETWSPVQGVWANFKENVQI